MTPNATRIDHGGTAGSRSVAIRWEIDIVAAPDTVFMLLQDLRGYSRWLPRSSAYRGTLQISDGPIGPGTTYVEPGPLGVRHGHVRRFVFPTELDFEQPMTLRPKFLGTIGIRLRHRLHGRAGDTHLVRELELSFRGPVRFAEGMVVQAFSVENDRMLRALKNFAEAGERGAS